MLACNYDTDEGYTKERERKRKRKKEKWLLPHP
jgi:hypothetical protein